MDCGRLAVKAGRLTNEAPHYVDSRSVLRPPVSLVVNRPWRCPPVVTTSRHKIPTAGGPGVYSPDVRLWMRSVTCS